MKKLFIIAAAALVGMAGCSKEGPKAPIDGFGAPTMVDVYLNFASGSNTRADGEPQDGVGDENKVTSLELYVFNDNGTALDTKVGSENGYVAISGPAFSAISAGVHNGLYKTQIEMSAGSSKEVLVIANAGLGTPADVVAKLKLQDAVKYTSLTVTNLKLIDIMSLIAGVTMDNMGSDMNVRSVPTNGFVMTGINLNALVVAEKSNNKIQVDIDRNVSRIEAPTADDTVDFDDLAQSEINKAFGLNATTGEPNVEEGDEIEFEITGYAVVGGMLKSTAGFVGNSTYTNSPVIVYPVDPDDGMEYINAWDLWNAGEWTAANANGDLTSAAGEGLRGGRIKGNSATMKTAGHSISDLDDWEAYSGMDSEDSDYILTIDENPAVYAYESKPGWMTSAGMNGFNADQVVALIIEGNLTAEVDGVDKTVTRYWRVNIRVQDAYHLIRNAVYKTTISKLVTVGWATPWEAEEEVPIIGEPGKTASEFEISISPWTVLEVGPGEM